MADSDSMDEYGKKRLTDTEIKVIAKFLYSMVDMAAELEEDDIVTPEELYTEMIKSFEEQRDNYFNNLSNLITQVKLLHDKDKANE